MTSKYRFSDDHIDRLFKIVDQLARVEGALEALRAHDGELAHDLNGLLALRDVYIWEARPQCACGSCQ